MLLIDATLTFADSFQAFRRQTVNDTLFNAGCTVFLLYDQTNDAAERLTILYILYALYAELPLERNPFLTFFLEFVDGRGSILEQHFVHCLLSGQIEKIKNYTPLTVCEQGLLLDWVEPPDVSRLRDSVARLLDFSLMLGGDRPKLTTKEDKSLEDAIQLVVDACNRTLTLQEQQVLLNKFKDQGLKLAESCQLPPERLRDIVDNNHFVAVDIIPTFLQLPYGEEYLKALAQTPVSSDSIEVVHHLATSTKEGLLSQDFLHLYISSSIRTCDLHEDGPWKDKHVRLVARFLHSLLEKNIIPASEYLVEIQSFCVGNFRFKDVTTLFQRIQRTPR